MRILTLRPTRYLYALLMVVTVVSWGAWPLTYRTTARAAGSNNRESGTLKPKDRLREGTKLVDVTGHFKLTGDRATFYPSDGSTRFGGLENLALERVSMVIAENPTPVEWIVSGEITEFKGNNYLLVTRAILKSKPSSPQPFSTRP